MGSINNLRKQIDQANNRLESLSEQPETRDPVSFCTNVLGFTPTDYQRKALLDTSQFLCLRWSRQSGKTIAACARILWTALTKPGALIAVVSPSLRQSKFVMGRIGSLARSLPKERLDNVQKTKITFTNGSVIHAFPNNPDTIRGPSLDLVYCDEMNFIRNDKELYDAFLFTISTTQGTVIVSSTPGSRDSLFYKICHDPAYPFSRHHVTWKEALEPNGPLNQNVLGQIRKQLEGDPWRWMREMEAEFAENEESYFSLALITGATDESLSYVPISRQLQGKTLYAGIDFGKHHDPSAIAIVDYDSTAKTATLLHLNSFPLETDYSAVIGYAKRLSDNWSRISRITTDSTGVGDVVTEQLRKAGLGQTWGIAFTPKTKTDVMENLHRMLTDGKLKLVYDPNLIAEMNSERSELNKAGQLLFSHPAGSHDDRLWALALACHGLRYGTAITKYHPFAATGKIWKPRFPRPSLVPPGPNWILR